jgi:hypothetical protein
MKKIIILFSVFVFLFITSCEIDNYEEPNASVHGYFYDAKDGKTLIGTDIIDGNSIGVYEQGFKSESKQTWAIDNTGEYTNKRVFAATYRIEFLNTNFYPYEGEKMWTVKRGYNERDFLVTPFLRINNASIIYDASSDKIIAKCKIEEGGSDVTINQIRLFVFTDKWVGNRINSGIQGASILNLNGEQIDPNKEYTLIIDRAANKNFFQYSRNYYFRIGAQAKGPSKYGTIRHNYSPLVVIKI